MLRGSCIEQRDEFAMKKICTLMLVNFCLISCPSHTETVRQTHNKYDSFRPGEIWRDTDGNRIEAHGGGMFYEDGAYYWFGEHGTPGRTKVGVMCYSSKDLYNWKKEGVDLPLAHKDPDHDLAIGCALERPKVIHNPRTKKYVMWFHLELKGQGYDSARSGVAVSDEVTGPYTYLGSFRPNNCMARDMTLFVDDDGKAYQFYASEDNRTMHVSLLSDDYLRPSGKFKRIFTPPMRPVLPWHHQYGAPGRYLAIPASAPTRTRHSSLKAPTFSLLWANRGRSSIWAIGGGAAGTSGYLSSLKMNDSL
jgi:hypothetical protein